MTFDGNYENISGILMDIQRLSIRPDTNYRISLSIYSSNDELVLTDSGTLKPVECLNQPLNNCFLIEKSVLDKISSALSNMSPDNDSIIKTDHTLIKTESHSETMSCASHHQERSAYLNAEMVFDTPSNQFIDTPLNTDLYVIEDHDTQCTAVNRPTVFAIKQMTSNYYLLFYRKSVYDAGVDNNFRKYLAIQPGTLVAYRYCHSVNSIRSEFANLNLSLRHNGKNELSRYQADHILQSFNSLLFL